MKATFLSLMIADRTLKLTPKAMLIMCLDRQIPIYIYIGYLNNAFSICQKEDNEKLKVMEGPRHPQPQNDFDITGNIIQIRYVNTCKPVPTSGYEELNEIDIKNCLINGSTRIFGFKSSITDYVRYIRSPLEISQENMFILKSDLYKFKERYQALEDKSERNERLLIRAASLFKGKTSYHEVITILTAEEEKRSLECGLPILTYEAIRKIVRKKDIMRLKFRAKASLS